MHDYFDDMSSRVLRKLQGEKDLVEEPNSDPETDLPISGGGGGARRKQLNINRYDLVISMFCNMFQVVESFLLLSLMLWFTDFINWLIDCVL